MTRFARPAGKQRLSFYFRDEVLPYYAGDTSDARDSRPTISSTGS